MRRLFPALLVLLLGPLVVLGVSMDILYQGLESVNEAWSRPQTWLIDGQGRVAGTYVGLVTSGNLRANIDALLAEQR